MLYALVVLGCIYFQDFPSFPLEACRPTTISYHNWSSHTIPRYLPKPYTPSPTKLFTYMVRRTGGYGWPETNWGVWMARDELSLVLGGDMLSEHPYPCQSYHPIQAPPILENPPHPPYQPSRRPQRKWTQPTTITALASDDESHRQRHRGDRRRKKLRLQHA